MDSHVEVEALKSMAREITTRAALINPQEFSLTVSAEKIIIMHKKEKMDEVQWKDVVTISVESTNEGDLLWILTLQNNSTISIPLDSELEGHEKLLEYITSMKEFDHYEFLEASSSSSDKQYIVWQKNNKS